MLQGKDIAIGISGGIAAYKSLYLIRKLVEEGANVWPIMTPNAERFVTPLSVAVLAGRRPLTNLWSSSESGEVSHVELAHRVTASLIAPTTADLLSRLAQGRATDPLTALCLSTPNPVCLAPAMETEMWNALPTIHNLENLRKRGFKILHPNNGALASGREGIGRLPEPDVILDFFRRAFYPQDLIEKHILVTAGPTREPIDPARFLSNPSSGKMGFAIAQAATERGAHVHLVHGPTLLPTPTNLEEVVKVNSTQEMLQACATRLNKVHTVIMAAAPADFRPAQPSAQKLKKGKSNLKSIALTKNPDIIQTLSQQKKGQYMVGFAAESEQLEKYAREKLAQKGLDLIVANDITAPEGGFGSATNTVLLLNKEGETQMVIDQPKIAVAHKIIDFIQASVKKETSLPPTC
ncbi:MAG: bifunctional phosphopantothenoylcysteine decarboxylase/phosphopantothenate--cysteine ligase CoaBC [Myxococcota bacterium]|nr:bifunctional phosphopantothenoylcysteine decarboxylase/phosphopantothenate--cysteine ligase CoaBC [Myxococcota bacterium]